MQFIDLADIFVKAGDGGAGMSHFRREKYVPAGGPDGGNGGRGGNVFIQATERLSTLLEFRYQRRYEAENGGKGGTNNRQGKTGEDLILQVPCGTIIRDSDTGELIGEVLSNDERVLVVTGGRGGLGNSNFATSRNQAPTKTIPPTMGERRHLILELKMIADVGIIGSPNAGKSTLITVISAAKPKVADYPFTTLVPTLGVVSHKDAAPFVVADVPGLIVGASEGKGLGHNFLRHIERTRVLVHLIDGSQDTAEAMINDYVGILEELRIYNPEILERPRVTVISKVDSLYYEHEAALENSESDNPHLHNEALEDFRKYLSSKKISWLEISSAHRIGITSLLDTLVHLLGKV